MDRIEDILSDIIGDERLLFPMPGTVQGFDVASQTISVQTNAEEGGESVLIEGVAVIMPGGGGWSLTFHMAQGDRVLLIFCSRDVYFWLTGNDAHPAFIRPEYRTAVAIPVLPRGGGLTAGTSAGITLRNTAGSVVLHMSESGIDVEGDLSVTGNITATQDIIAGTAPPNVPISLLNHVHSGVTVGSGSTGGPTPAP